ncbi:hypothetical protein K443DRAFT_135242 [Laccaria amethystina LaAM-08-1]|uniref:Uncharacterized protein n=1 Tax=Laccaria amethystina LaAM-08-1 TaxID=1095629 RepID=A0A0C9WIA6_9AGAR|nr:hypothetical protein K443DRAFT_135242 [Laccaria amethystina LaAM-08-1]
MITISHIIAPLIHSVLKYATPPAQHLPTFRHPAGVGFQIKASHKDGGFMAHGATLFCSFCLCTADQIEDLNLQSSTLHQATKSGRKAQAQSTGVRSTPLHRLPYWDPVKHVLLGYMHNWQEGVLKHQLHTLWAIGPQEGSQNNGQAIDKEEQWTATDVSESDEDNEVTGDPDYIPETQEHFTFTDAQLQAI